METEAERIVSDTRPADTIQGGQTYNQNYRMDVPVIRMRAPTQGKPWREHRGQPEFLKLTPSVCAR
jgi:hypothetical protein